MWFIKYNSYSTIEDRFVTALVDLFRVAARVLLESNLFRVENVSIK